MSVRYPCQRAALQLGTRRTFFSAPPATKFTIDKVLPHTQVDLFGIISDIDAYANFVPFCKASRVTARSGDDGRPVKADLVVGYKGYEETFTSQVKCISPTSVEAVSSGHALFERLATAWRVSRVSDDTSRVHLDIEYKFSNPVYGALSQAVLPKVADQIIEAFRKHAAETLR